MQINITTLWKKLHPAALRSISGSQAEHGPLAAQITWANARAAVPDLGPLSFTLAQLEALDAHFAGYGAWDAEERAAWTVETLLAMLVQEVASDAREAMLHNASPAEEWERYEADENCTHRLYATDPGEPTMQVFFDLGA